MPTAVESIPALAQHTAITHSCNGVISLMSDLANPPPWAHLIQASTWGPPALGPPPPPPPAFSSSSSDHGVYAAGTTPLGGGYLLGEGGEGGGGGSDDRPGGHTDPVSRCHRRPDLCTLRPTAWNGLQDGRPGGECNRGQMT